MSVEADRILANLHSVAATRQAFHQDAASSKRLTALKAYQQERFRRSYAQALQDREYRDAANFFLTDLYGPGDFSQRDAQFARVVPALVRLFPKEIVSTVAEMSELHALSETLDAEMSRHLDRLPIERSAYVGAWQAVGRPDARRMQVALMLDVGSALDRHTRRPLLRQSLKLMRGPARAAGLSALQGFLERGLDSFRAMRDAKPFLAMIAAHEGELAAALFSVPPATVPSAGNSILECLP